MRSDHNSPQQHSNAAQVRNTRSRNGDQRADEWRHLREARLKVTLQCATRERKAPNVVTRLALPSKGS